MADQDVNSTGPLAVDIRELSRLTGLSERTLWTHTRSGKIPHARIGSRVIYPLEQIKTFLRSQTEAR